MLIPRLECIVMYDHLYGSTTQFTQRAGRLTRLHHDKTQGIVVDLYTTSSLESLDYNVKERAKQFALNRMQYLRETQGYEVVYSVIPNTIVDPQTHNTS